MVQFGAPFPHFESLLADVIVSLATEGMYERGVIIVMIIAIETMFNASSSDFHESHDRVWCRLGGGQLPSPRHDATGQKDVKRLCVCVLVCSWLTVLFSLQVSPPENGTQRRRRTLMLRA